MGFVFDDGELRCYVWIATVQLYDVFPSQLRNLSYFCALFVFSFCCCLEEPRA